MITLTILYFDGKMGFEKKLFNFEKHFEKHLIGISLDHTLALIHQRFFTVICREDIIAESINIIVVRSYRTVFYHQQHCIFTYYVLHMLLPLPNFLIMYCTLIIYHTDANIKIQLTF